MAEKDRKQKLSIRFVITRRIKENSKKIEKKFGKFKNIKYYYGFISCQNKRGNADKWRK